MSTSSSTQSLGLFSLGALRLFHDVPLRPALVPLVTLDEAHASPVGNRPGEVRDPVALLACPGAAVVRGLSSLYHRSA